MLGVEEVKYLNQDTMPLVQIRDLLYRKPEAHHEITTYTKSESL